MELDYFWIGFRDNFGLLAPVSLLVTLLGSLVSSTLYTRDDQLRALFVVVSWSKLHVHHRFPTACCAWCIHLKENNFHYCWALKFNFFFWPSLDPLFVAITILWLFVDLSFCVCIFDFRMGTAMFYSPTSSFSSVFVSFTSAVGWSWSVSPVCFTKSLIWMQSRDFQILIQRTKPPLFRPAFSSLIIDFGFQTNLR